MADEKKTTQSEPAADQSKSERGAESRWERSRSERGTESRVEGRSRYGLRGAAETATEEFGGPIIDFAGDTVTGTLRATGAIANDAVDVVRDVLVGAVHATEEVGTETLGAVSSLGNGVVTTARDLLVGSVGGIRDILGSALPLRRGATEAGTAREGVASR
ncbi:hypothetical protein C9I57_14880 [Trinickia symbiotica]|uniref:Uncharacterized protein n=1 Tax=Trinickia symbiotica TaxID=863227 RepID=A0A2T3XT67_9BURK|nr:hypothetical protein [Trinickia symbiotica]PTB19708.1 hypothetical protein C9I57_14880 [Trinickia symbiotica]